MERSPLSVKIQADWKQVLNSEFEKPYFLELVNFIKNEKRSGKEVYPPGPLIFSAFDHTPPEKVKVVIIGQDPYHGPGQAHGLCFSVKDGVPHPPSLVNIFKELGTDLGIPYPKTGDLTHWADQGVLLLNATLTVQARHAGSHQHKGWEVFTDSVIDYISQNCEHVVFMLWGGYAKKKGANIDRTKHLVLTSGHPSPLSANKGYWFGNRHFSQANEYLVKNGKAPVDWSVDQEVF